MSRDEQLFEYLKDQQELLHTILRENKEISASVAILHSRVESQSDIQRKLAALVFEGNGRPSLMERMASSEKAVLALEVIESSSRNAEASAKAAQASSGKSQISSWISMTGSVVGPLVTWFLSRTH